MLLGFTGDKPTSTHAMAWCLVQKAITRDSVDLVYVCDMIYIYIIIIIIIIIIVIIR